jgi:beta-glucosidase
MDRRCFLQRGGRAALGAAALTALPSWAAPARDANRHNGPSRFAIDWARVQPAGVGPARRAALDAYSRVVDELLERGLAPQPILADGPLPPALEAMGGWSARATAERFGGYAEIVARALGDRVRRWLLLDQPSRFLRSAHPGSRAYLRATHVTNLAVGQGRRAIRATVGGARIGTRVRYDRFEPAGSPTEDAAAAERRRRFEGDWFAQPLLLGSYPNASLGRIPYDLLEVEGGDLAPVPLDFIELRIQHRFSVTHDPVCRDLLGLQARCVAARPASARDRLATWSHFASSYVVRTFVS